MLFRSQLQESVSGNTSEAYLGDLQTAARMYEAAGDLNRALPMFRRAVALSDLLDAPRDTWRRPQTRIDAALALARTGQFDEAEALAQEALVLQREGGGSPTALAELDQIHQMKRAAARQ